MTNEELEVLKQYAEKVKASKSEVCPSCGHCPTCGRGGHHVGPWVIPMPYYPQPWGTTTVICETSGAGLTSASGNFTTYTPSLTYTAGGSH